MCIPKAVLRRGRGICTYPCPGDARVLDVARDLLTDRLVGSRWPICVVEYPAWWMPDRSITEQSDAPNDDTP